MKSISSIVILAAASLVLCGCAQDLQALANDPATASIHQVVQTPAWSVTTDITRVNSTGTAASASASGVTVNVPSGSVVNPGPAKSGSSSATSTTPAATSGGVTIPAPSQASPSN